MMKKEMKIKIVGIIILGTFFWYLNTINKKLDDNKEIWNISNKLDTIIEVSKKGKIDSLQYEIMYLGNKLDSMILEHDYGFTFTK